MVGEQEWNAVIVEDWRPPAVDPSTSELPTQSADGYEIGWYPGPGYDKGHGHYLRIYLHTTESQDWLTPAEDVAAGQTRDMTGSYHYLIDDDHIINTVATKHTAWGLHLDNPVSVQIAMVCTSGTIGCWQRTTKTPTPRADRRPARSGWPTTRCSTWSPTPIATVATDYDIPIEWIDIDGIGANRPGVSSHHNYSYGSRELHGRQDSDIGVCPRAFRTTWCWPRPGRTPNGLRRPRPFPAADRALLGTASGPAGGLVEHLRRRTALIDAGLGPMAGNRRDSGDRPLRQGHQAGGRAAATRPRVDGQRMCVLVGVGGSHPQSRAVAGVRIALIPRLGSR